MNALKKNKRLGWVVLLLIVMNIVSLSALWIGYTKRPGGMKGSERVGANFLKEQLGLTAEQVQSLETLRMDHFSEMEGLRREFLETRETFHKLPRNQQNTDQMDDLAAKIGGLQAQMEKAIYHHFSDMRDLLTEDQKEIFDNVIDDVLRRGEKRGGPHREGPPPRRPGGHGPPPNGN